MTLTHFSNSRHSILLSESPLSSQASIGQPAPGISSCVSLEPCRSSVISELGKDLVRLLKNISYLVS